MGMYRSSKKPIVTVMGMYKYNGQKEMDNAHRTPSSSEVFTFATINSDVKGLNITILKTTTFSSK